MKWLLVLFTLVLNANLCAQIYDDFSDGDLTVNPKWSGMLNAFKDSNATLQSNFLLPNSSFYLSVPFKMDTLMQWTLDAKLAFNTSSVNYMDFVLCSDSSDLLKMMNGWLIRCGGSADNLSLIKMSDGKEINWMDGVLNCFNHTNNEFSLELETRDDSIVLSYDDKFSNAQYYSLLWLETMCDGFAGIRIKQSTSSFYKKHFVNAFYIGPPIKDSVPLQIDSILYLGNHWVRLKLSESLNRKDSIHWQFLVDGWTFCPYDSIQLIENDLSLKVQFPCLLPNQYYNLNVAGLYDMSGNKTDTQNLKFFSLVTETPQILDLVINEMMVDPEPSNGLPEKEFVELYNRSGKFIDLKGLKICDPNFCQPIHQLFLFPDSFLVCYDLPSLNNSDDIITLKDENDLVIHQVHYMKNWYQDDAKSNGGYSLEMIDPQSLCKGSLNWKASNHPKGGTPGLVNSVYKPFPPDTVAPGILKQEFIFPDRIDCYFTEPFDSITSIDWPCKINGLPADAFIRHQDAQKGFLSLRIVRLFSLDSEYSVAIKGVKDCDLNQSNWIEFKTRLAASPKRNDLIFNEVLFNPKPGAKDYIELFNRTSYLINLNLTYLLDTDNGDIFPLSDSFKALPSNCFVLICSDTLSICKDYKCGVEKNIKLQLKNMPSMPDEGVNLQLINQNWEVIDSLVCSEDWHFQLIKDRNGVSLERIHPDYLELSKINWTSASSLSGYGTPARVNSQYLNQNAGNDCFQLSSMSISPDNDGFQDRIFIQYQMPGSDNLCTIKLYNEKGFLVHTLYNNFSIGSTGILVFDGLNDSGDLLDEGIYLLQINCHSPDKQMINKYFTLYLVR